MVESAGKRLGEARRSVSGRRAPNNNDDNDNNNNNNDNDNDNNVIIMVIIIIHTYTYAYTYTPPGDWANAQRPPERKTAGGSLGRPPVGLGYAARPGKCRTRAPQVQ